MEFIPKLSQKMDMVSFVFLSLCLSLVMLTLQRTAVVKKQLPSIDLDLSFSYLHLYYKLGEGGIRFFLCHITYYQKISEFPLPLSLVSAEFLSQFYAMDQSSLTS